MYVAAPFFICQVGSGAEPSQLESVCYGVACFLRSEKKQSNLFLFLWCPNFERLKLTNNPQVEHVTVAGAGAVTLVYPLDMAYTCLAADHTQHRRFRGVWHVFGAIRREHGFFNLYRGLPLCCLVSISDQSNWIRVLASGSGFSRLIFVWLIMMPHWLRILMGIHPETLVQPVGIIGF